MKRREWLIGATAAGAATLLPRCRAHAGAGVSAEAGAPRAFDPSDWESVRAQFPLDRSWIHMSQFFLASHPTPVREALEAHRRGLDDNPFAYTLDNLERFEKATRQEAASYLGCGPDDLAMTDSTTMGLSTFYGGLRLKPGLEVLSTTHDHPAATSAALDYSTARTGATLRRVPLYQRSSEANADAMVEVIAREIRPETRVVAVTWVHSGTGVKTPIAGFAKTVAAANAGRDEADRAILCVDGVHGFGIEDETMPSLGCDVFAAGCHKWLFGPRGTGLLFANERGWRATSPTIPTFDNIWRHGQRDKLPAAARMTPGGFHSFEHRWALAEAFRFHRAIGKARIAARIHEVNEQCRRGLLAMPKVVLHTPLADEVSAGIICFEVAGFTSAEVVARLKARRIIASVSPYEHHYARLAPSLLTSPADVDASLRAVRELG